MESPQPTMTATPEPVPAMAAPKKSRRTLLLIGIIVTIALVAGAFLLWRFTHQSKPIDQTSTSQNQTQNQVVPDTVTDTSTKQYTSNGKDLKLNFSYPASWTVTPPSGDNSSDQTITATSPLMSVSNEKNQSVTGRAIITIRPGGSDLTELASDKATAGQASAQIAYTQPTASQRKYPYLTYIHLLGGDNPSALFEEVMITGATTFAKDQTISAFSLGPLDPIVSARFYQCSSQACSSTTAASLSLTNETWQSSSLGQQVLAIFQSLQFN